MRIRLRRAKVRISKNEGERIIADLHAALAALEKLVRSGGSAWAAINLGTVVVKLGYDIILALADDDEQEGKPQ